MRTQSICGMLPNDWRSSGRNRQRIVEFTHFVSREDFATLPAIGAIFSTGSHCDAAEFLGTTHAGFTRMRTRLSQLGECLENGETVPMQRKPLHEAPEGSSNSQPCYGSV